MNDTWIKVAVDDLAMKGFRHYGYMEYADNISVLHSRLKETIDKRQVPEKAIQEVNKLLEEMMTLQLEEESADGSSKNCTANGNDC